MTTKLRVIRAVVVTRPYHGIAVLQWRELLGEHIKVEDYGTGPEQVYLPRYGRILASIDRPIQEFYDHKGSLTEYVEEYLPRPQGRIVT